MDHILGSVTYELFLGMFYNCHLYSCPLLFVFLLFSVYLSFFLMLPVPADPFYSVRLYNQFLLQRRPPTPVPCLSHLQNCITPISYHSVLFWYRVLTLSRLPSPLLYPWCSYQVLFYKLLLPCQLFILFLK